jgi:hypothetical protein
MRGAGAITPGWRLFVPAIAWGGWWLLGMEFTSAARKAPDWLRG